MLYSMILRNWVQKSLQAYIFVWIYILSHHKIQVSIGLIAEAIWVKHWILKLNRNDVYKIKKKRLCGIYGTDNPDLEV